MTWERTKSYGSGKLRFALVIEGWPEIWVTDHSLTLTSATHGARGRDVRVGLIREGLGFSDRALLKEGKIQASGMRVRIRSNDQREHALASFARVGTVAAQLGADLETDDTSITLQGSVSLGGTYYHIGTEVIYNEGEGEISRGHWDTQAQSFYLADVDDLLTHQVYNDPRTAEGRRATLFVWGDGDDVTGYDAVGAEEEAMGQPIWRGIVAVPPQLESDGLTWALQLEHISSVFSQSLGARSTELRPVGIQFNDGCALYVGMFSPFAGSMYPGMNTKHMFWSPDVNSFMTTMNQILAALVANVDTLLYANFTVITIGQHAHNGGFYLQAYTNVAPASLTNAFCIDIRSHLTGRIQAGLSWTPWVRTSDNTPVPTFGAFDANSNYRCDFVLDDNLGTQQPSDTTQTLLGMGDASSIQSDLYDYRLGAATVPTDAEIAEWNVNRVFINAEWSSFSARALSFERATVEPRRDADAELAVYQTEAINFDVAGSGYDATYKAYWVEINDGSGGHRFHGWLHGNTVIRPVYAVEGETSVVGLVNAIITDVAANANDGNLPFIRDTDFDTSTDVISHVPDLSSARGFRFVKSVAISDVIAEELKLLAYMWSIDRDTAKLTFVPMPILTGNLAATQGADGVIGATHIQTPHAGQGKWPSYEIQSQGIVGTVNVKDGYDSGSDEHTGTTWIVKDANLLSTHKRRGVTDLTIAPKSTAKVAIDQEVANRIAGRMMSVCGREYATIKVAVSFARFRVQLGDIVILTSPHVPNADGTRGVTSKRCLVVGREWTLDPGVARHGELELLALLEELAGYCPSGVITSQSGSLATWTVTLDSAHPYNVLISPGGDGAVAATFAVGDAIRIVMVNAPDAEDNGDYVTGAVTAQTGDTVSVALDATWTPGSDGWSLEYDEYDAQTSSQRLYASVCGADGRIGTDEAAARTFA